MWWQLGSHKSMAWCLVAGTIITCSSRMLALVLLENIFDLKDSIMMYLTNIIYRLSQFTFNLMRKLDWERLFLILFVIISPILVFYNLELNPRPWHDEGSSLSIPKTLVENGVYATRNSDGYQTFGPVQSIGPTVVLPVALSFKFFGVGLLQGRIVSATYAVLTLWIFLYSGYYLFGRGTALLAVGLMLGSPAAGYLLNGRQVLGEAPALGFFLAGWLMWAQGVNTDKKWYYGLAGLLIGLAMITKSQYIILGMATLGLLVVLDFAYYRQGIYKWLIVVACVAAACVAGWLIWQINYFGAETFNENASKMSQLAKSTVGFNLTSTIDALRFLFGSGSGHFYFFWGWPALLYVGVLSFKRNKQGLVLAFLTIFTWLWLAYFSFLIIPWFRYFFPAGVLGGLFVAKLFSDLAKSLWISGKEFWDEFRQVKMDALTIISPNVLISIGAVAGLATIILGMGYQLQKVIRSDVLDKYGADEIVNSNPPQYYAPQEITDYLNQYIEKDKVIETWERELGVLTEHNYHYPDQVMLAQVHSRLYRGGNDMYSLGDEYFAQVHPDYLIIGWYSRLNNIYNMDTVEKHGDKIASFGSGEWRYDVYKLEFP